jgi:integrase
MKIIRLLILTGARTDEIAQLEWSEIHLDKREIILPKSRMKNAVAHTIFLSLPVIDILQSVERRKSKRYVFGQTSNFFSGWSKCKARLDRKLGDSIRPWRHHDLRRTLRTNAANLGLAPPLVLEAALGHWGIATPGVVGVYDHYQHDPERRKLMDDWANAVLAANAQA